MKEGDNAKKCIVLSIELAGLLKWRRVCVNIQGMKKSLWLLAVPLCVFLFGAFGNERLLENAIQPGRVSYSKMDGSRALSESNCIPLHVHKPFDSGSLPSEKISDVPDIPRNGRPGVTLNEMSDILTPQTPEDMDRRNESAGRNLKKKGVLGTQRFNAQVKERADDNFLKQDDAQTSRGWLADIINADEENTRRMSQERNDAMESEAVSSEDTRRSFGVEPFGQSAFDTTFKKSSGKESSGGYSIRPDKWNKR